MLTERQLNILRGVIQLYTASGVPVGSKTLMEHGIQASSATIRNELMFLEEKGLLEKTHSSSGRIPSLKGYRYYVDYLMQPATVSEQDQVAIRQAFATAVPELNALIQQSAKALSHLTHYTAFLLGPEVKERRLTGFRVIPLNRQQLLAIIVTDQGTVENQVFSIDEAISAEDIEKMVAIINERLVGLPLLTVYQRLRTEIPQILQRYFQTPSAIFALFEAIWEPVFEDRVFVGGQMNLFDYAQLHDVDQLKSVYSLLEDNGALSHLLAPTPHPFDIQIGHELENELLQNMSLIRATYEIKGHGKGTIALLGPTDMSYDYVLGIVDAFRTEMTNQLADYYRALDLDA